jgi:PAS domain S-box-containing protein
LPLSARESEEWERLRESESRLRLACDAANLGIWDWDLITDVIVYSDTVKTIFGLPIDEPIAFEMVRDATHPEDYAVTDAMAQRALDPDVREKRPWEYRILRPDGEIRWVVACGEAVFAKVGGKTRAVRFAGTLQDVTEAKRTTLALKASEEQLRRLNETLEQKVAEQAQQREMMWRLSQDLLVVIRPDGIVTAVNPTVETLGYHVEEVVDRHFSVFVDPEDMPGATNALLHGRSTPQRDVETRVRARDGAHRWLSWSTAPSEDAVYAVGRDVTEEKAQRQALMMAEEALRQSQKLEAMGQLTGGVAHDFNNLLTPIIASLDMLQRRRLGDARDHRLIDGALQSAERAQGLVQRLLAFARRQPLQPSPVDVAELVQGMRELIASTCGPRTAVQVHVEDAAPPALADRNQLEMALLNLAVNARDAMPDGGRLSITVESRRIAGADEQMRLAPGAYVCISVADTGVGMDEDTLRRAAEPFFSTKGVGHGTGLGLSMVHGLAAQLGGALMLSSKPGLGTRAELWLPVAQAREAVPDRTRDADLEIPGSGVTLLVDDDELVRASTAHMLGDLGFVVVEARAGLEALARLKELGKVDLLVTDHLMPGMTGADLARRVLEEQPQTKVLIISGYADTDAIAPDLPRLAKPFRQSDLAQAISKISGKKGHRTVSRSEGARARGPG